VAASTRHISHSGHAHLRCIKCNIVAVVQRRRSRPGKIPGHQQPATPRTSSPPGTTYPRPPNPVLHLMQLSPELEPGHHPPAAPPPAPPCREARDELKPPAAFRITGRRTQPRRPRPGPVGDLDPDDAFPGNDRDRDCLPGSSRAGVPDTITEDLADQQDSHIPARVPRSENLRHEPAGGPRPLRPPGKRHALPDRHPGHHRTRPSPAAPPRETSRAAGGRRDMHAQLRPERQAVHRAPRGPRPWTRPCLRPPSVDSSHGCGPRPWPSVQSRRFPAPLPGPDFRPLCVRGPPQHPALQRHKVTHAGTEQKRPASTRYRS
jgi:hypothetical protein